MTPDSDNALDIARRIADGEAIDLSGLEANDPDLARRLGKLHALARTMNTLADAGASWGHLQRLQLAGQGGFGAVYRAYDPTLDRPVALKLRHDEGPALLPSGVDFVAEARRLARVRHPNVLAVHGASYHGGRAGIWTDWIEGETLTTRIARSGPLRGDELLRVLGELADALHAVHQAGLVHGDIKASNVMLDHQGHVILMDFGAGFESNDQGNAISAGTPRYLAPEIAAGNAGTLAVDLYAYGVLAHLLATGRYPEYSPAGWKSTSTWRGLDALITRLLDADPAARPRTESVSRILQNLIDAPKRRARRWLLASIVVGLIGIAAATLFGLHREQRQRQRAERVSEFLAAMYREQDPLSRNRESEQTPAVLIAAAVSRVTNELGDDPLSQAQLLRVLGEAQLNLSELAAAHETLDLAASKLDTGSDTLLGAEVDALRAAVARRELRNDEAERYFDKAMRQAVAVAGEESVAVGRINALSASTFAALSQFKQAKSAAESASAVLSRELGEEHPDALYALIALGSVQDQLRLDQEALATLRKVVGLIEKRYGPNDARLIKPLQLLSEVLRRDRDFPAARIYLDRGELIARKRLGERNMPLAEILVTRASMEVESGEFASAIAALDAAELALPEDETTSRAQVHATRGKIWMELGDSKRAEPDMRAALKLRRETGGLRTGIAWFSQAELAKVLSMQGRFEEAQALFDEAELKLQELLGPDAYQNALISVRRATAFQLQEDWPRAAANFRKAIRIEEKVYGLDHFLNFSWNLALAQILLKMPGEHADAAQLVDSLIARWGAKDVIARDYAELMLLRCDLYAAEPDLEAARTLALSTLQHPNLIASAKQTAALKRHAGQL